MNLFPSIFDNPILVRELRRRMRGRALVYSMIGYICIITLIALFIMLAKTPTFSLDSGTGGFDQNFLKKLIDCGTSIFSWITGIQLLLVLIIAPTITAGMTTAEKERKTFEFLQVTTIHPWAYVMGSFLSTVFYVVLALLCALPPLCLAFLYGGVAPSDVVYTFLLLLAGSLILSSFGLYISSVRERTRAAQGIVVFMIFLFVFGGMTFLRSAMQWLGGGFAGAGGAGTTGGMYVFGFSITSGILVALATIFLTGIFLLLAARKLYQSDERAFAYWQFGLLFLLAMGVMIGLVYRQTVSDAMVIGYGIVSALLLATAAVCYGVGRMEVGDEIWHLKRLIPALRPIDESLLFLGAVALIWVWASYVWLSVPAVTPVKKGLVDSLVWVGVSGFVFFVFLGRLLTAVFYTRKTAGRLTMAGIGFAWIGVPLLGTILASLSSALDPFQEFCARFSPIFLTMEFYGGQGTTAFSHLSGLDRPGLYQSMIYLVLAAGVAVAGEIRRLRYSRRFNYHYEMPEG